MDPRSCEDDKRKSGRAVSVRLEPLLLDQKQAGSRSQNRSIRRSLVIRMSALRFIWVRFRLSPVEVLGLVSYRDSHSKEPLSLSMAVELAPRQLLRPTADKAIASAQPTALTPLLETA